MLGVTFGSKHSYNDWGIWLEDTHINPPLPKRYIVDVPARNGLLDLTPELTPTIRFENRTLTFTFRVKAGDWSTLVSQIYGQIHGQTLDVVSDLDPNWHWHGCVTVDDFSSDERTGVLVITVDADPFKLSNTENSYTVNGDGTITCVVDRMEISPAFEIEAPTTVIYGDSSYVLESTATTEKTLSGDIVSFADGTANPAVGLTADIDATQDLHGYDAPWVGGAGKNLLKVTNFSVGQTKSVNGVDFTYNSDGSFTINGTSSTNNNFVNLNYTANTITIPYGVPVNIGFYASTTNSNVNLQWSTPTGQPLTLHCSSSGFNISADTTATLGSNNSSWLRIQIPTSGTTVNNLKIYPFWCLSSNKLTQYEPYTNICPISGWDEVNVTRTGLNLFNPAWVINRAASGITSELQENGTIHLTGTASSSNRYVQSNDFLCLPAGTYRIRGNPVEATARKNQVKIDSNGVFTVDGKELINFTVRFTIGDTVDIYESIILTKGSEIIDYEPYNGNTYTIDLDGTRYGGTLDVTTGVLTVTHGYVDLGNLTWIKQTNASWNCFSSSITGKKNGGTVICSNYPQGAIYGTSTDKIVGVNANSNNIYVRDSSYMSGDATAFKTAMSGVQLVYELATPQTVQLTAEQVTTLKNQNNIWADSGEVEVTYLAQDFAGRKFFIPDLELTEGSHSLTIQGTGTTKVTYTNGRL